MSSAKRCETCLNWEEIPVDANDDVSGLCKRYAPRMTHGSGAGYSNWEWPATAPNEWCGEWSADE